MANEFDVVKGLRADLSNLVRSLSTCIASQDSFVRQRRDELDSQIAALDVLIGLAANGDVFKHARDVEAEARIRAEADRNNYITDAMRFANLREILVSLNEPNVMDTLGMLIENAANEVAARHPKPTPEAINELADVIIRTAHANHS